MGCLNIMQEFGGPGFTCLDYLWTHRRDIMSIYADTLESISSKLKITLPTWAKVDFENEDEGEIYKKLWVLIR